MSHFNWSEQTSPEDKKEGRRTYFFCTNPTAKMLSLTLFKNGQYQLSCLGSTKRLEKMPLDIAQKEAVIWLMNNLREIQSNLYKYIDNSSELDLTNPILPL